MGLRVRTYSLITFVAVLGTLITAATAVANPPGAPGGGSGGGYRDPSPPPPPSPPPLTPAQQARADAIVSREMGRSAQFEEQLLDRVDAARTARGQEPLNRELVRFRAESALRRMNAGNHETMCLNGIEEEQYGDSRAHRQFELRRQLREVAERWVRQNPRNAWDRFVRWISGDDGPPSSGGNLATDISEEIVRSVGMREEQAASASMHRARTLERDGVLSEDPDDPDNYPSGPSIYVLPPGGPIPTGTPAPTPAPTAPARVPIRIPFRLPAFEPLFVQRGCGCSSARVASVAGLGGGHGFSAHMALEGSSPEPVPPTEEEIPSPTPSGVPPATPPADDGSSLWDSLIGTPGDFGFTSWRLESDRTRGDSYKNCYVISRNTREGPRFSHLQGTASIQSDNRGRSWRVQSAIATELETERSTDPFSQGEQTTIKGLTIFEGTFSREHPELRLTEKHISGQMCILRPEHPPSCKPLSGEGGIPDPSRGGRSLQIGQLTPTRFHIRIEDPALPDSQRIKRINLAKNRS